MGWTNFVILPKQKLVVEISRHVNNIEDYERDALRKLVDNELDLFDDTDIKVKDMTVKELCKIYSAYENMSTLSGLEIDKFLLFWLVNKNFDFEIKPEYNVDIEEYKRNGYHIIRINSDDNGETVSG